MTRAVNGFAGSAIQFASAERRPVVARPSGGSILGGGAFNIVRNPGSTVLSGFSIKPTASVLVSTLEKAGILSVDGRWVTVADRNRLKEASCECYDIIRKTYEGIG